MSATRTYKLVPLAGECGAQLVDGYASARVIAQDIAVRNDTDVVVTDGEGRCIVWRPDGSHRCITMSEFQSVNDSTEGA